MTELQPGRDMDAAIARLLGYATSASEGRAYLAEIPAYSTSDADAFRALDEWLAKHGKTYYYFRLEYGTGIWYGGFSFRNADQGIESIHSTGCPTRSEAVCRCLIAAAEKEKLQ